MNTRSKEKKGSAACCGSEEFKGMFEMMKRCCSGRDIQSDRLDTMERMMGTCCDQTTDDIKNE